ncbi:MAG: cysteine desulfurase, partial [Bacteroidetes bacterium]
MKTTDRNIIYLDNNATTPLDPRVLEEMMPYLTSLYGNASSLHPVGQQASDAVKKARRQVADLIGAETHEVVFTSGATEAINLAIKGVAEANASKGRHIVTVATEHTAVLDVCRYLESIGYEVSYLPVQADGLLDIELVRSAIRPDTILVSVMLVNNETGVIQPISEIAQMAHNQGALFMTDATQAVGKMPIDVEAMGIDLMPFSGHKLYGPKGVGALYIRQRRPNKVKIPALLHGGGHERGMRSGTLNVPGIVGLGKACELAGKEMAHNERHIRAMRDALEGELVKNIPFSVNGSPKQRLYNVTNLRFKNSDIDALMLSQHGIAVSNGSACSSATLEASHVLTAMGLSESEAFSSIRISLGRFNQME